MKTRVIQNEPDEPTMARPSTASPAEPRRPTDPPGRIRYRITRYRRIAIWAVLAALVLGAASFVTRPGSDTPVANGAGAAPEFAAIERFVEDEMAAQRIPGLALGIVKGNRIAYMRGFGKADDSGRPVTPQTPFIIGSVSKSFTALAIMQLVEAGKVELDAPVQRYLPWFRVADADASAQITVRHLLNHTSGLSTKTGRKFQGNGDTSDGALEKAVRELGSADLSARVGEKYQYSTINYSVLGLIVQTVAGRSYESYVQTEIFGPLQMRDSFTSQGAAERDGLASGYHYWFGRPRAADLPYNRGLVPAGYLISSAEDMTHYLIAQLNDGRYRTASVLSPAEIAELHQPVAPTPETGTSYGMGWFVGPINDIPAIYHQGETPNFVAKAVLVPESRTGVIVLTNADNSFDLFLSNRQGTIAEGVTSLLAGREPPSPPSRIPSLLVYALLFGLLVMQARGIVRSVVALRNERLGTGRVGPWWRIGFSLALNLAWAALVLVLVPKQLGVSLRVAAQGFPDLAYILIGSAVVALGWGVVRTAWAYVVLRNLRRSEGAAQVATS
jgi:CubicO group peptidase (beta-lactamase class C family)